MLNIKESVKILFIVTVSVLTVGCKKHNAEYTSSENNRDVSSAVSEKAAESEVVSSAENVSSEPCANVAQGSSAENSNIAKAGKTVSQIREQPKTSSAAPSNTDTAQTPAGNESRNACKRNRSGYQSCCRQGYILLKPRKSEYRQRGA